MAAPVLIIQGRNDTRTPPRPVEVYVERMQALGKKIDIEWVDGGHGRGGMEEALRHQEKMINYARLIIEKQERDGLFRS